VSCNPETDDKFLNSKLTSLTTLFNIESKKYFSFFQVDFFLTWSFRPESEPSTIDLSLAILETFKFISSNVTAKEETFFALSWLETFFFAQQCIG
jgi:hypothetical protein